MKDTPLTSKIKRIDKKDVFALTLTAAILAAMVALMIDPSRYQDAFENGLILFAMNVLPATFPYLFFTKILLGLGLPEKLAKVLKKPLKLFGLPSSCGFLVVMSFLSGYPIGAKLTQELFSEGAISSRQAKAATALTSVSGPIFIVGTVGSAIFGDVKTGFIVLSSNLIAAFFNGLVWRDRRYEERMGKGYKKTSELSDACYDTVVTVLIVGGYIALFNMLAEILKGSGIFDFLVSSLDKIPFFKDNGVSEGLVYGLFEMTKGCLTLSRAGNLSSVAFSSGIIAFGGLSVVIQSVTFLSPCGVSFASFLVRKITQALLAFGICYLFLLI